MNTPAGSDCLFLMMLIPQSETCRSQLNDRALLKQTSSRSPGLFGRIQSTMTVAIDSSLRGWSSNQSSPAVTLQDKYEVVKEIGDGSFGSVCLGRTRSAGAHVVRRNTMVCFDRCPSVAPETSSDLTSRWPSRL